MRDAPDLRTSASLLGRLRHQPTDQEAWSEFVDRYGEKIYGWCRRWHLQDADAKDVTQAVLASLCIKMRTFSYDPGLSFRGWLRTLTHTSTPSPRWDSAPTGAACSPRDSTTPP